MLITCWSAKGGVGTTVVAASLALSLADAATGGVLLADLAGDLPAVLGVPEPEGPGLAGWLGAGPGVPADALARLERRVGPGVGLHARGAGGLATDRAEVLAGLLAADPRPVVADCGRLEPDGAAALVAGGATRSLLVTRPCFLALRRATTARSATSPSASSVRSRWWTRSSSVDDSPGDALTPPPAGPGRSPGATWP